MAKYQVECPKCGENYTVSLFGPGRDRQWKLDNFDWTCDECKEKERQAENTKAAEANAAAGLPSLTGSPKQIAWAETIRASKLENIEKTRTGEFKHGHAEAFYGDVYSGVVLAIDDPYISYAEDLLKNQLSASWWIENRETKVGIILKSLFTANPPQPTESADVKAAKDEVKIEATVRPETPLTETVAEIKIISDHIEIKFPEKREDFRQVVKMQNGYHWNENHWQRTITNFSGPIEDRAAEIGRKLLAAGFIIRIYNESIRNMAISGEYKPEITRWVTKNTKSGRFSISWSKGDDFYQAARRIAGSRWDRPSVTIAPEYYDEVLDFAEMYGFELSEGARNLVEKMQAEKEAMLTVSVEVATPEKPSLKPGKLETPETVGIPDELKD